MKTQITGVPAAEQEKLRSGGAKPDSNVNNDLFFSTDWKPGQSLALTFTLLGGTTKLAPVQYTEPPLPKPADNYADALVVDFCPDGPHTTQFPNGHRWAFIKPNEQTRLVAIRVNPLFYKVNVSTAAVSLNTDIAAVQGTVGGLLKAAISAAGAGAATETLTGAGDGDAVRLSQLVSTAQEISGLLDSLRQKECLPDDLLRRGMLLERTMRTGLGLLTTESTLTVELNRLATSVKLIAARKNATLRAQLLDLVAFAERPVAAKEMLATLTLLSSIPPKSYVRTTNFRAKDHRQADLFRFVMVRKPVSDSTAPPITQSYDVWIIGRAKLDFSAGLVLTGLADQTVALKDVVVKQNVPVEGVTKEVDVVRKQAISENRDSTTLAFATLGHLYWRLALGKGGLNAGLTLGGGITTKGRPLLLFGGSILLGRQQRIVLSGGGAVGTRKELSNRFTNTANYYTSDPADFTYVDRTRLSWFAGLTFNFGQNEKSVTIASK